MNTTEKHEYIVWSQILADHTNSKARHAEARQNMERLEWKGVGEDLRHQIDELRQEVESIKTAESNTKTDAAEPSPVSRMSKTMKERFDVVESRLDTLDEKVATSAGSDIATFIREEIETKIGLAAVQAVANAVADVMGDKDAAEPTTIGTDPEVARRNTREPIELSEPEV